MLSAGILRVQGRYLLPTDLCIAKIRIAGKRKICRFNPGTIHYPGTQLLVPRCRSSHHIASRRIKLGQAGIRDSFSHGPFFFSISRTREEPLPSPPLFSADGMDGWMDERDGRAMGGWLYVRCNKVLARPPVL